MPENLETSPTTGLPVSPTDTTNEVAPVEPTKWWLDSQTVKNLLVTYVPPVVMLLSALGVKVDDVQTQAIIQGIVAIVGLAATTYAIISRFKGGQKLRFGAKPTLANGGK